jgi:predicted homoserine dehydrogenase-like protein
VRKDQAIAYSDVDLPGGRFCDELKNEQNARFVSRQGA